MCPAMIGSDGFQEADISGITIPVTKQNYFVRHTRDLAKVIKEAFYIAQRPAGAVHVDIPKDVLLNEVDFHAPGGRSARLPAQLRRQHGPDPQGGPPDRAGEAPGDHRRPGRADLEGDSGADRLRREDEHPVVNTLLGLSASASHPLYNGWPGMHGYVHLVLDRQRT